MPRDFNGASAPRLSLHAQRLNTLKLIRARRRGHDHQRRRVTEHRMQLAEWLLGKIIDGADIIGEGSACHLNGGRHLTVFFLVEIDAYHFREICAIGGDLSDLEDTNDAEDGADPEPSLGSRDREIDQRSWGSCAPSGDGEEGAEDEPSLGSTHMANQVRWAEGFRDGDKERDRCDDERGGDG
ncbi:MAG TPA: hypothetical protein VFC38_04770 [Stellaceae bacterium]|nr:hypothetical protein [Stellaceae bacterium]